MARIVGKVVNSKRYAGKNGVGCADHDEELKPNHGGHMRLC